MLSGVELKLPHENSGELLFPLKLETFPRNHVLDAEKLKTFSSFKLKLPHENSDELQAQTSSLLNDNMKWCEEFHALTFQKQQEQSVEFTA